MAIQPRSLGTGRREQVFGSLPERPTVAQYFHEA
jgi:hypothetical protein